MLFLYLSHLELRSVLSLGSDLPGVQTDKRLTDWTVLVMSCIISTHMVSLVGLSAIGRPSHVYVGCQQRVCVEL